MANYPNDGHFDLELKSSGDGWMGTFNVLVQTVVIDILSDGEPFGPVEVTLSDGTVVVGVLNEWNSNDDTPPGAVFTVTEPDELPRIIESDDVVGLRA